MAERLAQAQALVPIQTTGDFSYRNRRFVGPRLLRVGDAAGFMDPIFSAGVYLAMFSGKLADSLLIAGNIPASAGIDEKTGSECFRSATLSSGFDHHMAVGGSRFNRLNRPFLPDLGTAFPRMIEKQFIE